MVHDIRLPVNAGAPPRRVLVHAALAVLLAQAGIAHAAQTVTVRNAQLKVMKELRTRAELDEFHRYWGSRQPTNQTTDNVSDWSFTLDVVQQGQAQRWLYQSNGMVSRVDSRAQQVFQIRNPAAFNSLIGAPRY